MSEGPHTAGANSPSSPITHNTPPRIENHAPCSASRPSASASRTHGKLRRLAMLTRTVSSSSWCAASSPVPYCATMRSRASSSMSIQRAMNPPSPGLASAKRPVSEAWTPPQVPWPITTISSTLSWVTANSSAADTPCRPPPSSNGGTRLDTLRTTKISPGDTSNTVAGSVRLSEQAMTITLGLCPCDSSAQRSCCSTQPCSWKRR